MDLQNGQTGMLWPWGLLMLAQNTALVRHNIILRFENINVVYLMILFLQKWPNISDVYLRTIREN